LSWRKEGHDALGLLAGQFDVAQNDVQDRVDPGHEHGALILVGAIQVKNVATLEGDGLSEPLVGAAAVSQRQEHNETAPQVGHGAGAPVDLALGQQRDDLADGLGLDKEPAPDLHQDVVTVGAARSHQAAQVGRAMDLIGGGVPPDRFASDPWPDGQSHHLARVGFEHLQTTRPGLGQKRRVGQVQDWRLGKQGGTGGLLPKLLSVLIQAVEPEEGGVFFSVRWWWANRAIMAWALN
jgi:hypothetical protein